MKRPCIFVKNKTSKCNIFDSMRYMIEIDTDSKEGNEALKYLRKINNTKKIAIHKWTKLSSKDVALPGGVMPTDWQWEEYLNRKQGAGKPLQKALSDIKKKLTAMHNK